MSLQTPLYNTIYGTILPGGTLSTPFNIQGYSLLGLQALDSSVNGTLGFMVSDKTDVPDEITPPLSPAGVYRTLYTGAGVPVAVTAPSGQFAISSDALTPLKGYQFIRVTSTAQTNGLSLVLSLKAE
jgi:hypothetical protein